MNRRRRTFVKPETTTTTVVGPGSGFYGTSYTYTATVVDTDGVGLTPQGTIDFYEDATFIATVSLNGSGQASTSYAAAGSGTRNIYAYYTPLDARWLSSNGSTTAFMYLTTSTSVALSGGSPVQYGGAQILVATVTSAYGSPSGGSVDFYVSGVYVGTAALSGGSASFDVGNSRNVGTYSIAAYYSGSGVWYPSNGSNTYTITKANVTINITSTSPNPSTWGGSSFSVNYTISTSTGVAWAGTSNFYYNSTLWASFGDVSGSSSFSIGATDIGVCGTLTWAGTTDATSNFNAGSGSTYNHTQNKQGVVVSLLEMKNFNGVFNDVNHPNAAGQTAVFNGEVEFDYVIRPGTTVRLYRNGVQIATTTVSGGATWSFSVVLGSGNCSISVSYDGDAVTNGGSHGTFTYYQL